ncbi:Uu.00g070320.m01.CDS01 [Anthostomella pinea]|uniref:Uu.00g070320.m01.CDS01 n=1 Tax=Anthostomella pinea TaxID=933095 RepID=A0AAI8VUP0_9PEZI|nr:Uu.00g070320.m01.CDS01 [Anthostomella pinea]
MAFTSDFELMVVPALAHRRLQNGMQNQSSDGDAIMRDEDHSPQSGKGDNGGKGVGFRERMAHFTWANFACTQSTGGITILLSQTPYQFHGLQTTGVVVFILNLVLFLIFCAAMITRFVLHPHMIKHSFTNPPEPLFVGSFMLSMATSIICMERFGVSHTGVWLVVAIRVLFWIYAAITLLYATIEWVVIFAASPFKPIKMNPAVFLLIFNTMLTGTIAASIAGSQPPYHRLPILVAGIAYQGLGWIVSVLLLAWFLGSLLENGLGSPNLRPGLFMPVGSARYTIVSLIGCARYIPPGYGFFARFPNAVEILQLVALWVSIFLWLFTFWLFAIAFISNIPVMFPFKHGRCQPRMSFTLSWWGIIFPNVGFALATGYIGEELQSNAIRWVATVMTILLFAAWLVDLVLHFKSIFAGQIMWPGQDEDVPKSD